MSACLNERRSPLWFCSALEAQLLPRMEALSHRADFMDAAPSLTGENSCRRSCYSGLHANVMLLLAFAQVRKAARFVADVPENPIRVCGLRKP